MAEDAKLDGTNKVKRTKSEHVKQVLASYIQRRNVNDLLTTNYGREEMIKAHLINSELNNPNSVLYSCYNNDLIAIDHYFTKFVTWLKDLIKNQPCYEDLEKLIGPFFCHLYLEILRGGQTERSTNFFKVHLPLIDKSKCDETVQNLMNAFVTDTPDLNALKEKFRLCKYVIHLSSKSLNILKKYVAENGHVIFLQIFQTWFHIEEILEDFIEVEEECELLAENNICNGFTYKSGAKLLDAITALHNEITPLFVVNLDNVKEDVSCGFIDRGNGMVAYSYGNTVYLKPLNTLKQINGTDGFKEVLLRGHTGRIYDLSLHTKENFLVTASNDKTLMLFDLNSFNVRGVFRGHDYPVYCTSISPNGTYVVSGSCDYTLRLWSIENCETVRLYGGHTQEITNVNFHPNSLYFASSSIDRTVRMWAINDSTPCRLFHGSKGAVYSVAFSPCGKYVASAGEDKRVRIWDLATGKQFVEMKTNSEPILHICWSNNSKLLSAGTVDGTVRNWNFDVIEKNPSEINNYDPFLYVSLNSKLLHVDYTHDNFSYLTVSSGISVAA